MPESLTLNPSTDEDWAISSAFPFANPLATSNNTTSSTNSLVPIKCANVPPICPAPIKDILVIFFLYFIVGITNSALLFRIPEGHLEVIVFNFV